MRIHVHVVAQPGEHDGRPAVGWLDEVLERVDGYGIDRLSTGDVAGNHLECLTALGYMAARTSRVHIGPFVTTGAVRDPGTLASAALSLDAMTGGRVFMILGRGDGLVRNLGLTAQTVEQTRETVVALRRLLRQPSAQLAERTISVAWPLREAVDVPVYVAPGGPRMLAMSAAVCDGVYLATGCTEEDVRRAREAIAQAPRDEPLDVWWVTRFGIAETREAALAAAGEPLASVANHSLRGDYAAKGVPQELWEPLAEYHARYDYARKNPAASDGGPTNADLMTQLGLREYFLDRFGIVGTPEEVVDRLVELERRGVDSVTLSATSAQQLDLIGLRVLPALAARATA